MKILVVGSIAYDLLLAYDGSFVDSLKRKALDELSVAYVMPHLVKHFGGTGANIAWNLKLLGGNPVLVGTVGQDGSPYVELLEERGIDTTFVERVGSKFTATAIIATDDREHQITFFHPGADAHGSWPEFSKKSSNFAYAIVSPRDITIMTKALAWCSGSHVQALFDPGQQIGSFSDDELRRGIAQSAGIVLNEFEWGLIANRLNLTPEEALEHTEAVFVTRGERGAIAYTRDGTVEVPACAAERVVNPTGAGDAFRAGLLVGLRSKWQIGQCLYLACAMGSFAVETEGTLIPDLDLGDVRARVKQTYGEEIPQNGGVFR